MVIKMEAGGLGNSENPIVKVIDREHRIVNNQGRAPVINKVGRTMRS